MTRRDPKEWAEEKVRNGYFYDMDQEDGLAVMIADVIREAQEDGARAEREKHDIEKRASALLCKEVDRFLREREETSAICSALRSQVTALTEERSRVLAMLDGRDCEIDEIGALRDAALARADRAEKERDEWKANLSGAAKIIAADRDDFAARLVKAEDERDALGLQLAALRSDNERMATALARISSENVVNREVLLASDESLRLERYASDVMRKVAVDALTHGVDVRVKAVEDAFRLKYGPKAGER